MPTPHARRRRALELLASYPQGCTEAVMLAHGFASKMLVQLIEAGHATSHTGRMIAGGRTLQVTRVKITNAGSTALARFRWPCSARTRL
jgi:hypothetical protein